MYLIGAGSASKINNKVKLDVSSKQVILLKRPRALIANSATEDNKSSMLSLA